METTKNHTILQIDDNPGDVKLMGIAIDSISPKITLETAKNAEEAFQYLNKEGRFVNHDTPALIFLDINLPRKSGLEILEVIKADETLKKIPTIVLSSTVDKNEIHTCYGLHANAFIQKTNDFDEFVTTINSTINFWLKTSQLPIL